MNEELGFFYDVIHGRISLQDLPEGFRPALKAVLSSRALDRLKRISQLGHTSLSYFSATHTRFSHALGTMLVMNKLFMHINKRQKSFPNVFNEANEVFSEKVAKFQGNEDFVHCHMLLAAMYQDVGELPFQKVTSLFFYPADNEVDRLKNKLVGANPRNWSNKSVFSLLALMMDMESNGELRYALDIYDLHFLSFLITGDGCPGEAKHLGILRQMLDGAIDADRLDYVYRDASVTIGSLSQPITVLESIVEYGIDHVVVSDPRPIMDFISTRMRLWTFVYSAPDVRFRQALLKTFLQGRLDYPETSGIFSEFQLHPEVTYLDFLDFDDYELVERIRKCLQKAKLRPCRKTAAELLLNSTLDYECQILEKPEPDTGVNFGLVEPLPDELFFDLFRDHEDLQLYRPDSIKVQQSITANVDNFISIEKTSGSLSPLLSKGTSAFLVPKSYCVFRPRKSTTGRWKFVDKWITDKSLYWRLCHTYAERELSCKTDTRSEPGFDNSKKAISISYCSVDFLSVVRIVRELYRRQRRYILFLRPFDGTGDTPAGNSENLIIHAEAVLALVSREYILRATDNSSYIAIEVRSMNSRAKDIPIVPLGIDERSVLDSVQKWNWAAMNEKWRNTSVVIPNTPLRNASESVMREGLGEALKAIDMWKP